MESNKRKVYWKDGHRVEKFGNTTIIDDIVQLPEGLGCFGNRTKAELDEADRRYASMSEDYPSEELNALRLDGEDGGRYE